MMYLEFNNNNNWYLERQTRTGPKRLHILQMYLDFNNNNNGYLERLALSAYTFFKRTCF